MNQRIQSKQELRAKKDNFFANFSERLRTLSKRVCVVLVEPKYQGNIGAVARLLRNSGLTDLRLVNPPALDDEAMARSMGGKEILISAKTFQTLAEAVSDCATVAATSSEQTLSDRKFLRLSSTPWEFWDIHSTGTGRTALVFGREDDGLRNHEIQMCNAFIHIPANPDYPVYNLSHAVSIVLYEMVRHIPQANPSIPDPVSPDELKLLEERIFEVLRKYGYPSYKMSNGMVMIRRLLSRSNITESEFYKIMGMLRFVLSPWNSEDAEIEKQKP